MAPEQIRGVLLDDRVDLYACGVLLFELLTGQKPFHSRNDDPIEVCKMHLSDPIPRLDDKLPGVDFGGLEAVVGKALAKDRDDRYASAAEYAAAIDAFAPRRPSLAAMPPAPPSGPIQLASADVIAVGDVGDASYPPAVEVRSVDVMSAIAVDPPPPVSLAADPRRGGATPAVGVAREGLATPAAGIARGGLATPAAGVARGGLATPAAGIARGDLATPAAGVARGGLATPAAGIARAAGTATPVAGVARGRTATPVAGVARSASEPAPDPAAEPPSRPGTFLGLPVTAPGASGPREALAPAGPDDVPPAAGRWFIRRRRTIAIAAGALAVAVVVGVFATVLGGRGGTALHGEPGVAGGTASQPDPAREIVARAGELVAQGDREAALDLLNRSRRQYPDSAQLPYIAGRIYFSKYYWTDGLKSFRDALRNDPGYRTDPELIKTVLRGFIMTPGYNDELASFLRDDIGSAAQPFLEETARDHPNAAIRSRAANELRRYR